MSNSLRRCLTLCLAAAVWYACSARGAAAAHGAGVRAPAGDLYASGRVLLDGAEAVNGMTFFSGGEFLTEDGARAVLGLGALGRAELLPQSSLRMEFGGGGVSGALRAGGVRLSKPEGVAAAVLTGGGSVAAEREGAAVFTVRYEGGRTTVETQAGAVRLRLKGVEVLVAAGERYTEGQGAQATSHGMTGREKAAILIGLGGGIALIALIFASFDDEEEEPFVDNGFPVTPSPTR